MLDALYIDSLSGFANILSLITGDLTTICGHSGTILSVDLKNLNSINEIYGRQIGDLCIATCANGIALTVGSTAHSKSHISTYRIGGDGFLIIFKDEEIEEFDSIIESINRFIETSMHEKGVYKVGVNYGHWNYYATPESASELVQKANILIRQGFVENPLPGWVICHIDQMYEHIKDTITLLEKTSQESLIDSISQMPNNKAARQCLSNIHTQSSIGGKSFSVLFIDGDNLRRFNEKNYEDGNEMIRQLGKLIKSSVRINDNVFRWLSGDEFLVILPDTPKEAAYTLAERIRTTVASSTSTWEYAVTVSIGVSSYPSDGRTIEEVLTIAEKSNSIAKKDGKNCVR